MNRKSAPRCTLVIVFIHLAPTRFSNHRLCNAQPAPRPPRPKVEPAGQMMGSAPRRRGVPVPKAPSWRGISPEAACRFVTSSGRTTTLDPARRGDTGADRHKPRLMRARGDGRLTLGDDRMRQSSAWRSILDPPRLWNVLPNNASSLGRTLSSISQPTTERV